MAHDVFISYSNKDKPVADAVVAGLENRGIRCWVAPRDITPGTSWGEAIIAGIQNCKLMVIILSENSNRSNQVVREVERAVANNVIIIPFRIENIDPTGAMAYFLSTEHWLDAITPPLERHIEKLQTTLQHFMAGGEKAIFEENLKPPAAYSKAPVKRWKPIIMLPILLGIVGLAIIAAIIIPKLWGEPSTIKPTENVSIGQMTPVDPKMIATQPITPTSTPTPLPHFDLIGSWLTSRETLKVIIQNDIAYIANGGDGLKILDVSDFSNPKEIGSYPLDNAQNVIVDGQIAYITDQGGISGSSAIGDRLIILDIQTPSVPRFLGELTMGHRSIKNLAVEDQTVYLTRSDTLIAVDVSDPSQPETIGEFSFYSNVAYPGVAVKDGIVYMIANRLHIVDFHNPAEPAEIASVDTGWGSSIILIDQRAYITGWDEGLIIVDISNPAKPIKMGRFMELIGNYELIPPGAASRQSFMEASLSGEMVYLSFSFGLDHGTWNQTLESGIVAIDINDPAHPKLVAKYAEIDDVSSIFATDEVVFVTDSSRGLFILSKPQ
ncbi:MAG: TIR domain-containing protein [Anaerolineaceae bacterium]|nr:TIR domain-containing protein [Anaerolineaceae bacterium]